MKYNNFLLSATQIIFWFVVVGSSSITDHHIKRRQIQSKILNDRSHLFVRNTAHTKRVIKRKTTSTTSSSTTTTSTTTTSTSSASSIKVKSRKKKNGTRNKKNKPLEGVTQHDGNSNKKGKGYRDTTVSSTRSKSGKETDKVAKASGSNSSKGGGKGGNKGKSGNAITSDDDGHIRSKGSKGGGKGGSKSHTNDERKESDDIEQVIAPPVPSIPSLSLESPSSAPTMSPKPTISLSPTDQCTYMVDFEDGSMGGWTSGGDCERGSFIVDTLVTPEGITSQVIGDHTTGSGKALYTQPNPINAADNDVDNGECITESPNYVIMEDSDVFLWYFHGQRVEANNPNEDYFIIELSTDGGTTYDVTLVSIGDVRTTAEWKLAQTDKPISAGSTLRIRVRVADGRSTKDQIEGGIDDLFICPTKGIRRIRRVRDRSQT